MAPCGMMAAMAMVGMLAIAVTKTEALRVVAPSEGMTVVADR